MNHARPAVVLVVCATLVAAVARAGDETAKLKTFSSVGKEVFALNGYKEGELLAHEGKGCLTHMWFGEDWKGYERTRIRVYVDGEQSPSIDMELGLGHGYGFAEAWAPWGSEKLGKTGHPSGVYNTYRIPFGKSIRVTAQRAKESPDGAPFWWIVRGTENLPVMLGGVRLPDEARLKLHKLENYTAKPLEEFSLCDVKSAGALYQVTMAGKGLRDTGGWKGISYLEAMMRAYFDGSKEPVMLSSGLGRYFSTASSTFTFPSSTSIISAVAVIGFVCEAIQKSVSGRMGWFAAMSAKPTASRQSTWSLEATSVTAPARTWRSTKGFSAAAMPSSAGAGVGRSSAASASVQSTNDPSTATRTANGAAEAGNVKVALSNTGGSLRRSGRNPVPWHGHLQGGTAKAPAAGTLPGSSRVSCGTLRARA